MKAPWRAWLPPLGLLLLPALVAVAALIYPRLSVSEGAAAALTYAGGAGAALLALAVAAHAPRELPRRSTVALAASGIALVGVGFAVAQGDAPRPVVGVALVDLGLATLGYAVGTAIGRRVAHPGHLLPACAVAAAADLASVIHPAGVSHAIAGSARALSLVAVGFPVPGTPAVAPVLGLGDLVFLALVFGVAVAHRFSVARVAAAAALGIAVAGALSARFEREIPALVPIGAAVVALVPEARRVRAEDRRTTVVAVAVAVAVVVGVLLSPR